MADLDTDYNLGDVVIKRASEVVEYNATITKGQGLNIESVNAEGQAVVGVAGAGEKAQFVAMFAGADGELHEALTDGLVKITFGGVVASGAALKSGATGKFVAGSRILEADGGLLCGSHYTDTASADTDTGLINFKGGAIP